MEGTDPHKASISYDAPPDDDDEEEVAGGRLSSDSAVFAHDWLTQENESLQLLSENAKIKRTGFLSRAIGQGERSRGAQGSDVSIQTAPLLNAESKTEKRTRRRHGGREVIHKIEEGGSRSTTPASESSDGSSEVDREKIGAVLAQKKVPRNL